MVQLHSARTAAQGAAAYCSTSTWQAKSCNVQLHLSLLCTVPFNHMTAWCALSQQSISDALSATIVSIPRKNNAVLLLFSTAVKVQPPGPHVTATSLYVLATLTEPARKHVDYGEPIMHQPPCQPPTMPVHQRLREALHVSS